MRTYRAHFRLHFHNRGHSQTCCEHSRRSLRGDPVVRFAKRASTFVGISVGIFVYTPMCISWALSQGQSNMRQIVVAILCHNPLFPRATQPFSGTGRTLFCEKSFYFYRTSYINPLLLVGERGGKSWRKIVALKAVDVFVELPTCYRAPKLRNPKLAF